MPPHSQAPATTRWIGAAPQIEALRSVAMNADAIQGCILITGERGTGRNTLARLIHEVGGESPDTRRFHCVDCHPNAELGPVPENGTIQLRGVERLSMAGQRRLLDFLEANPRARVISTTCEDLRGRVREGRFKEELFYRLATLSLAIPPLRFRRDDIPILARHFLERRGSSVALGVSGAKHLRELPWDGNVSELEKAMAVVASAMSSRKETELSAEVLRGILPGISQARASPAHDESEFLKEG